MLSLDWWLCDNKGRLLLLEEDNGTKHALHERAFFKRRERTTFTTIDCGVVLTAGLHSCKVPGTMTKT